MDWLRFGRLVTPTTAVRFRIGREPSNVKEVCRDTEKGKEVWLGKDPLPLPLDARVLGSLWKLKLYISRAFYFHSQVLLGGADLYTGK